MKGNPQRIGRLRECARFFKRSVSPTAGQPTNTVNDVLVKDTWVERIPMKGVQFRNGFTNKTNEVTHRIKARYDQIIKSSDLVDYVTIEDYVYKIQAIEEIDMVERYICFYCTQHTKRETTTPSYPLPG